MTNHTGNTQCGNGNVSHSPRSCRDVFFDDRIGCVLKLALLGKNVAKEEYPPSRCGGKDASIRQCLHRNWKEHIMTQKKYFKLYLEAGPKRNYRLLNNEALRPPGKKTWAVDVHNPKMPDFPVRPHILFDTKDGGLPGDVDAPWGGGNCWIISYAAKLFFEKTVPDAVEFFECETSLPNGDPALPYWFVLVIPVLEAVDEERSKVKIKYWDNGGKNYSLLGKTSLALKESVVKDSHLFRLKYAPSRIICDEYFKAACEQAGLKFGDFDDLKTLGQY